MLDCMIAARAREEGAKKAADERKRKGETVLENLKAAKKLSAGVLNSSGVHSLNDKRFLSALNERRREAAEKEEKNVSERRQKLAKKIEEVKRLREKYGHETLHRFATLNKDECGIYLQYKKQSVKDPGMPKDLDARRARCIEWMARSSPVPSPHASDDENFNEEQEAGV